MQLGFALRVDRRLPRAAQVYERLRSAIIDVRLPPRTALSEPSICAEAKVSRTPVREALIRLSQEGLVEVLPQVGSFVAPIRLSKVVEGCFVREALELALLKRSATRWSAENAAHAVALLRDQEKSIERSDAQGFYGLDQAFHAYFAEVAGIAGVTRVIADANTHLIRVRRLATPMPGHMATALAEHRRIAEAVDQGDAEQAVHLLSHHLRRVFGTVRRLTSTYKGYFEDLDDPLIADVLRDFIDDEETPRAA